MSFPSVAAVAVSFTNVSGTSHTVSLPAGVVNGSRVFAMVSVDANCTMAWPAGWTELYDVFDVGFSVSVAYRDCDGSEGASIVVTSSVAGQAEHCSARIAGHVATAPIFASATGTSASDPDPPNCAPGLGLQNILWLVMIAHDADATLTPPASYTESLDSSGGSGTGTVWIGWRQLAAASEDPGAAVDSISNDWHAFTIAILGVAPTIITADAGSFVLSGKAATFRAPRLPAEPGAFALSGGPATFSLQREATTPTAQELRDNDAPQIAYVLLFEGYNLAFCDVEDAEGLAASWQAYGWSNVLDGLEPVGVIQHEAMPFNAEVQMSPMSFSFVDDDDDTVHRILLRPANDEAVTEKLANVASASLDNNDTSMVLDDSAGFPASGTGYIGGEEIAFGFNGGSGTLLVLTRGIRSLWGTLTDPQHFGRQHRIDHAADPADSFRPEFSTHPLKWNGRAVALYLCTKIRGVWTAGPDAEMIWAGTIRKLSGNVDAEGRIRIDCDSILKRLQKQLLRRQYKGYLQEGLYLEDPLRNHFRVHVTRYVSGGSPQIWRPAAVSILSGSAVYTHDQIAAAINAQLATWFDGTTTYFDDTMTLELVLAEGNGGQFYEFRFSDDVAGDYQHSVAIELNSLVMNLLGFASKFTNSQFVFNWFQLNGSTGLVEGPAAALPPNLLTYTAENAPLRAALPNTRLPDAPFILTNTVGDFERQTTIPDNGDSAAWDPAETHAFFKVGGKHIIAVKQTGLDAFRMIGALGLEFEPLGIVALDGSSARLLDGVSFDTIDGADTDGVVVEQVWFETGRANDLLTRVLLSTGTPGYNHSDFDDHPQQMGLGLPWTMVDVGSVYGRIGPSRYVLWVPKRMDFLPLLESAMQVRNLHAFFHRGQIRITGFGESSSATLRLTLDETGRLIRDGEAMSAAAQPLPFDATLDYLVNEITLRYNIPFGSAGNRKPSQVTVYNSASQTDLDESAPVEIDALGFYDGVDVIGTSGLLEAWNTSVAAPALAYYGSELWAIPCSYDFSLLLELYPGRALLLSNDTLFHPRTGRRGWTDVPVWCVQTAFDHSSGLGECLLLVNPRTVP